MTIAEGDKLPDATFRSMGPDGIDTQSTSDVFGGKKVVLFAVPGAFTPTCHLKHLPGFIEAADAIKAKGVDEIVCLAVNDPFVLAAWSEVAGAGDKVKILSDGNGEFTAKIGMGFDGSGVGLGTRSKRYAMIVEDGVVTFLRTEEDPSEAEVTAADSVLAAL